MEKVIRWKLTKEMREKWRPVVEEWLGKLEKLTEKEVRDLEENATTEELEARFKMDLSDTEMNPSRVAELLKELGYGDDETEDNGWQWDFWWTYKKDGVSFPSGCEALKISGTGATFELVLSVDTDLVD